MKITPRSNEIKAVIDLMERDDFPTAQAMAKEIVKTVAVQFGQRDLYAWVWKESDPDSQLAWGVFSSESEAQRRIKPFLELLPGRHMVLPLAPIDALEHSLATNRPHMDPRCECKHTEIVHQHPNKNGRCVVRGCGCKKYALSQM